MVPETASSPVLRRPAPGICGGLCPTRRRAAAEVVIESVQNQSSRQQMSLEMNPRVLVGSKYVSMYRSRGSIHTAIYDLLDGIRWIGIDLKPWMCATP